MVDGYRRISVSNHVIEVPKVSIREDVELHLVPDILKGVMEIRIWWKMKMVHSVSYPLKDFRLHL
jgi:hypothetical protein